MEKRLGNILVDVSPPEKPKFKAPLILVHGLWTSSRCWRSWATHFSNLGWECWAVNFQGRFEKNAEEVLKRLSFPDCVNDLKQVIRAAEFPPVLLGHDLGGLAAYKAVQEEKLSALILLAGLAPREVMPELPRALKLLRLKYAPLLFLRRPFPLQEKDFRENWLNALPADEHAEAVRSLVADSPHLIREFFARGVQLGPGAVHCPMLIAGGRQDRVVPLAAQRALGERIETDFRDYAEHGHWIMGESDGEEITRDIHRWIIQKSGEEILAGEGELA
ncbi:MAG TPA: alpha/beta hydrolase [Candidatus Binatia bacterium]